MKCRVLDCITLLKGSERKENRWEYGYKNHKHVHRTEDSKGNSDTLGLQRNVWEGITPSRGAKRAYKVTNPIKRRKYTHKKQTNEKKKRAKEDREKKKWIERNFENGILISFTAMPSPPTLQKKRCSKVDKKSRGKINYLPRGYECMGPSGSLRPPGVLMIHEASWHPGGAEFSVHTPFFLFSPGYSSAVHQECLLVRTQTLLTRCFI